MRFRFTTVFTVLAALTIPVFAQTAKPDAEGFIRNWYVLAPAPLGDVNGFIAIDEKQFADEAQPRAFAGGKQRVGDVQLEWVKVGAPEFYVDFLDMFPIEGDRGIAWAVAYVVSPDAKSDLTLRMNSNDQGKVYLNGKEVIKFTGARGLDKAAEDSVSSIALKAGVNVVVLKIVNEGGNWQGSLRFVDKAGKPVTDISIDTNRPQS